MHACMRMQADRHAGMQAGKQAGRQQRAIERVGPRLSFMSISTAPCLQTGNPDRQPYALGMGRIDIPVI
jgi:hypothetical protein